MIELRMETTIESENEQEAFRELWKDVSEEQQVKFSDYETIQVMDVCPEGKIIASYEKDYVTIYAQSNVAGPGFHAFVARIFDELINKSDYDFAVHDPTNYYEKRDFEELKYRYFYPWLQNVCSFVLEQKQEHVCLCWPQAIYEPFGLENHVVTPSGYYAFTDFEDEIETLAQRFFIWNQLERDASYYRNCANALMWKEGFFEYSDMNAHANSFANQIADYLEAAYDLDSTIDLPYDEYALICNAIHREVLLHGKSLYRKHPVGYRKSLVYYALHTFKIACNGFCEQSYDAVTDSLNLMAPYKNDDEPWSWHIKANVYPNKGELFAFFDGQVVYELTTSAGQGVYCCFEEGDYLHGYVQVNHEGEALLLEIVAKEQAAFDEIINWCQYIYPVVNVQAQLKH